MREELSAALMGAISFMDPDNYHNYLLTREQLMSEPVIDGLARSVGSKPKTLAHIYDPRKAIRVGNKGSDTDEY